MSVAHSWGQRGEFIVGSEDVWDAMIDAALEAKP